MKSKKSKYVCDLECLTADEVEKVCHIVMEMACTRNIGFVTDVLICVYSKCGCLLDASYAKYFASRLRMFMSSRIKKDVPAYHRLLVELVVTLALFNKGNDHAVIDVPSPQRGTLKNGTNIHMATTDVNALMDKLVESPSTVNNVIDMLLNIKNFDISIEIEQVAANYSKDPLWCAWKIITSCVVWTDAIAKRHVSDLYFIYCYRYSKASRRERVVLLKTAWQVFWGMHLTHSHPVINMLAVQAAIQAPYLAQECRMQCKQKQHADDSNDVFLNMT